MKIRYQILFSCLLTGLLATSAAWSTPETVPGDDLEEVEEPGKPVLKVNVTPEQKTFIEFDELIRNDEPGPIEHFFTNHPEFNLNKPTDLVAIKESGFQLFADQYRMALLTLQDFEKELDQAKNPKNKESAQQLLEKALLSLNKKTEILQILLGRGADPSKLKLMQNPWWANGKDMSQVNEDFNSILGKTVFQSQPKTTQAIPLHILSESGLPCTLNDFAPGIREVYEKITELRKTKRQKLGELVHLYSTTEEPGCVFTLIIKQKMQGGYPALPTIESARIVSSDGFKELRSEEIQKLIEDQEPSNSSSSSVK